MGASRLRLMPIGLSVLVNLALIGLMARVLVSAPAPEQRYIAVELRTAPTLNVQRSLPLVHRSPFTVHRSLPSVGRSPFTVHHSPSAIDHRPLTIARSPAPLEVAGSIQSFIPDGGGTSATGPGVPVGEGSGGGTIGSGEHSSLTPTPDAKLVVPSSTLDVGSSKLDVQPEAPNPPPKGESRAPSVAKQTKPIYPPGARDDGVEGVSVILALIDPQGKVTDTKLEKSSGDRRLDRAALDAVRQWTYSPCLKDGVPARSSVRIKVEFRLE